MKIYIYDLEVLSDDWIAVFKNVETKAYTVIHNDNYHLREFLSQPDIVIGGFYNKHYDDWILQTILQGGSNVEVKKHNDFIIKERRNGWEFPFIQYKKRTFKSFDLRDDIADQNISLKAIEGNLKLPIVESSIPFDIDRPLTAEELDELITYCKYDVDSTERLYWVRKQNYLDAKILAGSIYGIDEVTSIGYTNARLSAEALDAKYTERDDERDYVIPERLPVERIPKIVLDFFMQIRDKSIPDAKLFGAGKGSKGMTLKFILKTGGGECPITFAWGGVHGGVPCITIEADDEYMLINDDVESLYPNSKINFGYCSRSMSDQTAYKKLVDLRLHYKAKAKSINKLIVKKLGVKWFKQYAYEDEYGCLIFDFDKCKKEVDEETYTQIVDYIDCNDKQASLKLIINTCYGAMLAKGNGLYDRLHGRSVCITNQLCMSILISDLAKACKTIWFININTDGVMFRVHKSEVEIAEKIVADWCELTGFSMERDDFVKVIQKDVNNYIGITSDGKFKTKGGYVSLYEGGNFKSNSLQIIHKAIVDYLVKGIEPEKTINECDDIFAFQQIVKTGGTYEGSYHYIDGERVPIQKVNRIYAVKDSKYGQVVKGKWITEKRKKNKHTGKMESTPIDPPQWSETVISECPEHAFIDNENTLKIENLDKDYYIDMAKRRIDKYINIDKKVENELKKIKEVVEIMATKTTSTKVTDPVIEEIRGFNIFGKLAVARGQFLEAPVAKSGINRFAEYKYFELSDIVPVATSIFNTCGLVFLISFDNEVAKGTLVNVDKPEETIEFTSPMRDLEVKGMNAVQALGGVETYQRRYLYMTCLDIVEADAFDATQGKPDPETGKSETPKKTNKPATPEKREEVKKELIDEGGKATDVQIKSIKNALKKLREKDEESEPYIMEIAKKIKAGLDKAEAENILIEIGKKVAE